MISKIIVILIYFLAMYIGWRLPDILSGLINILSKSKRTKHSTHSKYVEYEEVESINMCKSDYDLHSPTCIDNVTNNNNKIRKK